MVAESCNTLKEHDLNADVAKLGITITDNIVSDSRTVQNLDKFFKFNRQYVEILNAQPKDTTAVADSAEKSSEQLIVAIIALNKVYQSYFLFADKGIVPADTKFTENVKAVIEILNIIIPAEKEKLETLNETANARNFNEKNMIFQINTLFLKYSENEFAIQKKKFAKINAQYEKQVRSIPASAFDVKKLATLVTEPVNGDNLLIEVYKLQLISQAADKVEDLNHSLDMALSALNLLNRMHAEFLKKQPDRDEIQNMIIRAQNIYPTIEKAE
jgi:hypothetical protein